jgi:hypothetical protein
MGLLSAQTRGVSNGRTAIHIALTNRCEKAHQSREHGVGLRNLSDERRKTMKKLVLIILALMALMISVSVAMARDANRDAMSQPWRDQLNLEKQQARIEGLGPATVEGIAPGATKPGTTPRLRAKNCSCDACKI